MKEPRIFAAIVAGHICVDITPLFDRDAPREGFIPGSLHRVGPAVFANGGAVANTGLAMRRFGNRIAAVAKVGPDELGLICRRYMQRFGLDGEIREGAGLTTSYSVVVAPPGSDRFFLHHPGANEQFCADDIPDDLLAKAHLLHLGYPTLMASLYREQGRETFRILARAKEHGLITSLDMQFMDPGSEAAREDWPAIMRRIAPVLDIFLPSYEELYEMLDFRGFLASLEESRRSGRKMEEEAPVERVRSLAASCLEMGIGVVGVKCGRRGIYLITGDAPSLGPGWARREIWAEALEVPTVVSATGAGDCAIAGFLTGVLGGMGPEEALGAACTAGAQNLRAADAYSGLGTWEEVLAMAAAHPRREWCPGEGWRRGGRPGVWLGPGGRMA
ncbi:MAG: carbohydrate kinase family protein [Patescibacteria group bacterium]